MASLPEPCASDLYLIGSDLPERPVEKVIDYDFQIIQLALRFVLPDASFARLAQSDRSGHEKLFAHAITATQHHLATAMRWNREHGILTFVLPYVVPAQNVIGRLLPRYDLRNPVYFTERLNEALSRALEEYRNTYLLDLNEIHAFYGKRFVQEDFFMAFNHGGYIGDFDFEHDVGRLEPANRASELFELQLGTAFQASWNELLAMYRTIRQRDIVKLVVVDLDDTLWRGVVAELDPGDLPTSEGWPKGLWEALLILKRRGILLGIISKNDESRVINIWDKIFNRFLLVEDFAIRRINWQNKAENMVSILEDLNILPGNVVYIDDNPAERAAIKGSFPEIRTLGGQPLTWRRILLWSPETQVSDITPEASQRTEMVQSQVVRQEQRRTMPRAQFLATLDLKVRLIEILNVDHPRLGRVLELLNRTNQFNTTGLRWSREDCVTAFARGSKFIAFEAEDRFTDYGLVGSAVIGEASIHQLVMSCRVIGLDIETAVMSFIIERFRMTGIEMLEAEMTHTEWNLPSHNLYERLGFRANEGKWLRSTSQSLSAPKHINLRMVPFAGVVGQKSSLKSGASNSTSQHRVSISGVILDSEGSPGKLLIEPGNPRIALTHGGPSVIDIEDVTFGRDGNEVPYLVSGWSGPERQQRWTLGDCSKLRFDRPKHENLILVFDVSPLPAAPASRPSQRAIIYCDNKMVGTLTFHQAGQQAIRLPIVDRYLKTPLEVRIELPDAARGTETGISKDPRCLGLCFRRLRLIALQSAPQKQVSDRSSIPPQSIDLSDYLRPDEVFDRFESLGQSRELGDVQRQVGLKPLGFLHRSGMPLRALVTAIERGFDGLGEIEALDSLSIGKNGEVSAVVDRNYKISFIPEGRGAQSFNDALKLRCGREMKRLRDKMFTDFGREEKVFVFQRDLKLEALTEAEILPLFVAIRRWGIAPVLFVIVADTGQAPGSAEEVIPGLFRAYVLPPDAEAAEITETWMKICSRVWAMVNRLS